MGIIRTFIAVEIDNLTKQKISELISNLKKSDADAKWIAENQMHLTLKFLGNIEENKVQEISDTLKSIASAFREFDIALSGIGAFPDIKRPRVIWIGIDKGADNLKSLANQVEMEMGKLGFEKEKRGFKSHLTLGRVRSSKNISNLIDLIKKTDFSYSNEIKINELILFQSMLTPKGAVYTQLAGLNLKK